MKGDDKEETEERKAKVGWRSTDDVQGRNFSPEKQMTSERGEIDEKEKQKGERKERSACTT